MTGVQTCALPILLAGLTGHAQNDSPLYALLEREREKERERERERERESEHLGLKNTKSGVSNTINRVWLSQYFVRPNQHGNARSRPISGAL